MHDRRRSPRPRGLLLALACLAALAAPACKKSEDRGIPVNLSRSTLEFLRLEGEIRVAARETVDVTWAAEVAGRVAELVVAMPPGVEVPQWLNVQAYMAAGSGHIQFEALSYQLPAGRREATFRVALLDAAEAVLGWTELRVSLDVLPMPARSPAALAATWVESEPAAPLSFTLRQDARIRLLSATVDVPWLAAAVAGTSVTLSPTAEAAALLPGVHAAEVRWKQEVGGGILEFLDPVSVTVVAALGGPARLDLEVDGATTLAALAGHSATVTAATAAPLDLAVQSAPAWLAAVAGPTGTSGNLALALVPAEVERLGNGVHQATLTLATSRPGVRPLALPVALTVRLPEVHWAGPVVFTDALATDQVIVRGQGLSAPGVTLRVDGQPLAGATVVNDTEVRLSPAGLAAGDHLVDATNRLGFQRPTGPIRVADPPAYRDFAVATPLWSPRRVLVSPINRSVYVVGCYDCAATLLWRFRLDPADGTWTRTEHDVPALVDAALAPDESVLAVLTEGEMRLLDPVTMEPTAAVTLPVDRPRAGRSPDLLATLDDGRVLIGTAGQSFDLRTRAFADEPWLGWYATASRDGGWAATWNGFNQLASRYDAATGQLWGTFQDRAGVPPRFDRHAGRFYSGTVVRDRRDDSIVASVPFDSLLGDLSPDGGRAYGYEFAAGGGTLRRCALDPFEELPAIPLGDTGAILPLGTRVAVDPSGRFAFVVTERSFTVVDVR